MMVRTKNNKVIDIVAAAVAYRGNMMNVNNNVPSAYHALVAEIFKRVFSRRDAIRGSLEVGIVISAYVFWGHGNTLSPSVGVGTCAGAKARGLEPIGLYRVDPFAVFAGLFSSAFSELWYVFKRSGLRLIRALARAIIVCQLKLRWFAIKLFSTLRAVQKISSFLLSLRGAGSGAVIKPGFVPVVWVSLKFFFAGGTSVCFHTVSF